MNDVDTPHKLEPQAGLRLSPPAPQLVWLSTAYGLMACAGPVSTSTVRL